MHGIRIYFVTTKLVSWCQKSSQLNKTTVYEYISPCIYMHIEPCNRLEDNWFIARITLIPNRLIVVSWRNWKCDCAYQFSLQMNIVLPTNLVPFVQAISNYKSEIFLPGTVGLIRKRFGIRPFDENRYNFAFEQFRKMLVFLRSSSSCVLTALTYVKLSVCCYNAIV